MIARGTFYWTARRKAALVLMVDTGLWTLTEVLEKYPDISAEEFQLWADALNRQGIPGLQVKQNQKTGPKRKYRRRKIVELDDMTKLSLKEPKQLFGSRDFRY
jgi:hypothetical protein